MEHKLSPSGENKIKESHGNIHFGEILQKSIKNCEKLIFRPISPKFSERVRTLPNASRRVQTHPNASEQVRAGPSNSENLKKLAKTCEKLAKTSRKILKKFSRSRLFLFCFVRFLENQTRRSAACSGNIFAAHFRVVTSWGTGSIGVYHQLILNSC